MPKLPQVKARDLLKIVTSATYLTKLLMNLEEYIRIHKKTEIILDFDETLFHLILPWDRWEDDIKDKLIKTDGKIYRDYENYRINLSQMQNNYVKKYPQLKGQMIKNSINFETKYLKDLVTNEDLVEFISKARGYNFFIWSSNSKETVEKILKKFGILNKFSKIVTRNEVDLLKPEIDGFIQIYNSKIPKSKYLFAGDSRADRQAAQDAGIDFYLVDYFK